MNRECTTLPWSSAAQTLAARARELSCASGRATLGITGPVGAGKSTLAAAISPCIISTDHYLPDYHRLPEHERDLPRHADFPRLARDLVSLKGGVATHIPRWSFHSHSREGETLIEPHEIIIVEGIHAFHEPIASLLDLRVYVDAPRDARWKRWETLESTGQRGWGVEKAKTYFEQVAEVTFAKYEAQYRLQAHVVVVNDAGPPQL